jgi:hypothetical protein
MMLVNHLQLAQMLQGIAPSVAGYASVGAIALLALIVFRVARRIVQLGYFALYFFIGFGIVYTASAWSIKSLTVPLSMPIIGGLAFAAVASAIRAKLMRIVGAVMLVALCSLAGKFWSQYSAAHKPGGEKSATEQNQKLAMEGLAAARKEFGLIAQDLPHKNGKIAPGFLNQDEMRRLGLDEPIEKVVQQPAWHTLLTGLYKEEKEELGIWTAGGSLEQAKKSLSLKPRPTGE